MATNDDDRVREGLAGAQAATRDGETQCRRVLEAALMECGEGTVRREVAAATGTDPGEDCADILEDGPTRDRCSDARAVRRWVSCRALTLINDENLSFRPAMQQAWAEIESECMDRHGIEV